MAQPDPLAEFVRTQLQVEHARCDAVRTPPPGHWSNAPEAEWHRVTAAGLQDLVFAGEDILAQYEAMRAAVEAAEDTVLAGAAKVRLGAYRRCVQALATAWSGRKGYDEAWRPQ
jgi:hypothetical protein